MQLKICVKMTRNSCFLNWPTGLTLSILGFGFKEIPHCETNIEWLWYRPAHSLRNKCLLLLLSADSWAYSSKLQNKCFSYAYFRRGIFSMDVQIYWALNLCGLRGSKVWFNSLKIQKSKKTQWIFGYNSLVCWNEVLSFKLIRRIFFLSQE